jgi:hypothetical protein
MTEIFMHQLGLNISQPNAQDGFFWYYQRPGCFLQD